MEHKTFSDVGIPEGYGFKQLLFSPAANALVVQTQSARAGWRPERLYFRNISDERYLAIDTPAELESQEYPVVALARPWLAYSTHLHRFHAAHDGSERHSASWKSVRLFDLQKGKQLLSVGPHELRHSEPVSHASVSNILGFGETGAVLYVVAGISRDDGESFHYFVSELNLESGSMSFLTRLPTVFM